jgi:GH24 family phage-related lysozyme (muramidase)
MPNTSDTQNPLMKYRSYVIKNILVAFTTTSDAVNSTIDYTIGKAGTEFVGTGCGQPGIVVVNEFVDNSFIIYSHENEFSFHSFFDLSTSSMTGALTITDSVGGYFQNFLRDQVASKLNISETHIIFALKTYIIGTTYDDKTEIIPIKPLIFHMYNLTHSYNDVDTINNFYTMLYVADYNTFSLLPNYSKMFQMTITHQDSNTSANIASAQSYVTTPTVTPTATITVTPTVTITPTPVPGLTPTPTVTINNGQPASSFSISDAGLNLIKQFEGLRLTAYWDVNAWAIGYGHRKGVHEGDVINQSQADAFLLEDLQWAQAAVRTKVTVLLDQGKYDALVSLTYNVGANGYKGLLAKLNSGDYNGAQQAFNDYVYSGGKVNQSLVNRRAAEAAIFGGLPPPTGNQPAPVQNNLDHGSNQNIDIKAKNDALNGYRSRRLNSDKTMKTIQDVMNGLEAALKALKSPPPSTLSQWLASINNNYVDSLIPNDQKKSDGILPIDYNINLDPIYNDYIIDNRNMPFEQPDQSQTSSGIKVYQVKPGKMLTKVVNNLMKLSNQVGNDAISASSLQKSYKCNISCVKTCDTKYEFNITIKQYVVPLNSTTTDSGPGTGEGFFKPLEFTYQKNGRDRDIIKLSMSLFSDTDLGIMSQPNNSTNNLSIYGNREQIMLERNPDIGFFNTAYSGVRGMANPKNFGLERPNGPISIDNLVKTNLTQTSKLYITIIGNPNLLSDLFRNPIKVSAEDADSPNFYKFPEYYPMYAKLDVYIKPSNSIGLTIPKDMPLQYYYTGYYHLGVIKSVITGSFFTQSLQLYRTDDKT